MMMMVVAIIIMMMMMMIIIIITNNDDDDNNVKVFEMDAEVEEMTRDRRNNILIHGLPVQEGVLASPSSPPHSSSSS